MSPAEPGSVLRSPLRVGCEPALGCCATGVAYPCLYLEMVLTIKPAMKDGAERAMLAAALLVFWILSGAAGWSQGVAGAGPPAASMQSEAQTGAQGLAAWQGLKVRSIDYEGVPQSRLEPLPARLALTVGAPITEQKVKESLRQLYATGLFDGIRVEASRDGDGVELVFRGTPRTFIGRVTVDGAKGATVNTQLERASQLAAGTRFTPGKMSRALGQMRRTMTDNGYYESKITDEIHKHPDNQLVDIAFHVASGPQARVGSVEVSGDPGMTEAEFRRYAHLRPGAHVDRDTDNRAIDGVLKHYQKQDRLEAEIKLDSQKFAVPAKKANFQFTANRGPVVKVQVEGAKLTADRVKRLIPVYQEGSVDDDLLNEGNRRLRDYFQRLGYYDVKVEHREQASTAERVVIVYDVQLGLRRRVARVSVTGNHYFDAATLEDLLSVHAANPSNRHGDYSQALLAADVSALEAVYANNGFSMVKVTPEVEAGEPGNAANDLPGSLAPVSVIYRIDEGPQQRVGAVHIEGAAQVPASVLQPLMNTVPGQLLSPQNLAGDRDALLTEFLSRGFDQAQVEVTTQPEAEDPNRIDVTFRVTEGQQIFVRKVLLTGLHYTRPDTIARAITVHAGDPLSQQALLDTQRNLYAYALFSEIETAVENPAGDQAEKTVLLQATEARRWVFTYGLGFEAQTGQPVSNCAGIVSSGAKCNPEGKTGVSPRVLGNLTRNNLFGREQSVSLQGTYGLLEQNINLQFQNPHFNGDRDFGLTFTGGYANSQDVTTYVASKLDGGMRWTEHFSKENHGPSKANTLIYEFDFRRVKVAASSLQVFPDEIPLLSTAVRVAGPGLTWIRDTRDSPMDSHRGTYTSFQEFLSQEKFGAQAEFNRVDMSNSSYYGFDQQRWVLARNTRYAQERAFGDGNEELIPLPERLYAGGPVSLRGFSINAAGPRDPLTGFPIGGAGAMINSTELRMPPPNLPWFGNTLSFVLFHDMGNVFRDASEVWPSAIRFHQPDRDGCMSPAPKGTTSPVGVDTSTGPHGLCSFDYFSHAPGLGLRYHTPVGPIRLDFSYNLNPPIFPVTYNYSEPGEAPYVGEASHFNFFFSLGQTF
jgi:outer membrane protein insertion porin family